MGHGIGVHGVDTGGEDADVGPVCAARGKTIRWKTRGKFRPRCRGEGHVDVVAISGAFAKFVFKAGVPGEERAGGLVEGDVENTGLIVECELDAVSVVGIDIEVQDAEALLEKIPDRDHDVVEVAESGGVVAARVVKSAGRAEDEIDVRL